MPCDSIILNRVEMPVMHEKLLGLAIKALGATDIYQSGKNASFYLDGVRCQIQNGKLVAQASATATGQLADQIKQAYSNQVVVASAAANGFWAVPTGPNRWQIVRR